MSMISMKQCNYPPISTSSSVGQKSGKLKCNIDKCKVLHIGSNNHYTIHTMNGSELSKVSHKKYLGVTISNDLEPSKHCSKVNKTANKLVGFISRAFKYKSEKVILTLFNALVRHLEYCIQFWSPNYKKRYW